MFLCSVLVMGAVHADSPSDIKKLDSFLKKEAPASPLNLTGADMRSYDLIDPAGEGKEFDGANMEGVNFSGKDLKRIKFNKVNFEGANFEGANLSGVSFTDCNLSNANFAKAKLLFGGFRDSNLSNINFRGAKFESFGFAHVNLTGANFDDADLFRVSMEVEVHKEGVSFGKATTRDCSGLGWFS